MRRARLLFMMGLTTITRPSRYSVVVLGAVIYLVFTWALVAFNDLPVREDLYLLLVLSWLAGVLVLSRQPQPQDVVRTLQRVFYRLLWFNVGGVAAAVFVPTELRLLMLVVPLFGVLYASLRLALERVLFIAVATWVAYAVSVTLITLLGSSDPRFELLAGLAFSFLLGASLYFASDLNDLRLRALKRHEELQRSVEALSVAAMRDELTGMFNRRYIFETLSGHKALADRGQLEFTICYCDLDHFKRINDTLGHSVGDAALVQFAGLACSLVRSMDSVARLGGEEFLLVLVGANEQIARRVCGRLCAGTKELPLEGAEAGVLSVSCGIARYRLGESVDELIARADRALYEAKRAGRDRVVTAGD